MSKNPFSQLPVEIWQEIFSQAADRIKLYIYDIYQALRSGPQAPCYIALVCQDWRNVALSTPRLWSDILVKVPYSRDCREFDALLSAWNLCLVRSQSQPLTIEFICYANFDYEDMSSPIQPFMKPLMENAQRLETVILRASLPILLPYLHKCPVQYSRLRRLCIARYDDKKLKDNSLEVFQDTPLLSCISLNCLPHSNQNLGRCGIPWSQILRLKISVEFGTLDDLMDILASTPNLVTLNYSVENNGFRNKPLPQLELSHLEQLVWTSDYSFFEEDSDGPSTTLFFNLLTAPKLSSLAVNGAFSDSALIAIRDCLQRSRCSITYLDLPTSHLSSLLSLTPDVRTIVFQNEFDFRDYTTYDFSTPCHSFGGTLELAHLRKVVLTCRYNGSSPLLRLIVAPKLSAFETFGRCGDIVLEDIRNFLQKSRCSITSLKAKTPRLSRLLNCTVDVETLLLPKLEKEELISLLNDLTLCSSPSSWLFPKLKKIILHYNIPPGPPFRAFIAMLKSRLDVPSDSLAKLEQLELGQKASERTGHWVRERLAPQEAPVITYIIYKAHSLCGGWRRRVCDEWDFSSLISTHSRPSTQEMRSDDSALEAWHR